MEIYKTSKALITAISKWKSNNPKHKLGFIPTMGALHQGHMSLLDSAKQKCDLVVVSVFVNPKQFNEAKDLERYPRTEIEDAKLLEKNECDILFLPEVKDIYQENDQPYVIDLAGIDKVMEGEFRPGHFEGVCNVVEKLLRISTPDFAFFGIKDFQQVAIVKHMVELRGLSCEIVAVPIKRSIGGLALSSRNALLSEQEEEDARIINWTLKLGKQLVSEGKQFSVVKENMLALFKLGGLELEYLEIVDNKTLKPINKIQPKMSACMAVYCGKVRLIDNIQLN